MSGVNVAADTRRHFIPCSHTRPSSHSALGLLATVHCKLALCTLVLWYYDYACCLLEHCCQCIFLKDNAPKSCSLVQSRVALACQSVWLLLASNRVERLASASNRVESLEGGEQLLPFLTLSRAPAGSPCLSTFSHLTRL